MFTADVEILPAKALQSLSDTLAEYRRVSGLTNQQVLAKKGRDLAIRLYQAFGADTPAARSITRAVQGRGFRFGGRQGTTSTGISETARDRASARLQGQKSILAQVVEKSNGRLELRSVRIGRRGNRLKSSRSAKGIAVAGSVGERFSQSLAAGRAIEKKPGDVVLNRRAVETLEEMNIRESGRRFLSVAWIYRRWLQVRKTEGEQVLINTNPRTRLGFGLLGSARLSSAENDESLTLSSFVPGQLAIGRRRGRFARAVLNVRDDMLVYLRRKQAEALRASLRGGVAAGRQSALSP